MKLIILVLSLWVGFANASEPIQKFIPIDGERSVYVDYILPTDNQDTLVLVNGLTYSTKSWDILVAQLKDFGFGILRIDLWGQGKTLLKYAPAIYDIPYERQVDDISVVLQNLKLSKVHMAGLSYGGSLVTVFGAKYPEMTKSIISMAPYVRPLKSQDSWIKKQIEYTHILFPFNPASDDELYDYFLKSLVYATYPVVEPVILENPYKLEATFRLAQGSRTYDALNWVEGLGSAPFHLIIAENDQYIDTAVHTTHWDSIPDETKGQLIFVNSEHKIPEDIPGKCADIINTLITGGE